MTRYPVQCPICAVPNFAEIAQRKFFSTDFSDKDSISAVKSPQNYTTDADAAYEGRVATRLSLHNLGFPW